MILLCLPPPFFSYSFFNPSPPAPTHQDIFVDTEIAVPVPGDIVEVPFEVPKYVDKIIPKYVPGKIVRRPVSVPVERIIEVPV